LTQRTSPRVVPKVHRSLPHRFCYRDGSVASMGTYDEAVRPALLILWEAADRDCGKSVHVLLPSLVTALEQHGHLDLDPTVRHRLLVASPATIDRLLTSARRHTSRRKKRKGGTRPADHVLDRLIILRRPPFSPQGVN
jgi:hypothetical protein